MDSDGSEINAPLSAYKKSNHRRRIKEGLGSRRGGGCGAVIPGKILMPGGRAINWDKKTRRFGANVGGRGGAARSIEVCAFHLRRGSWRPSGGVKKKKVSSKWKSN